MNMLIMLLHLRPALSVLLLVEAEVLPFHLYQVFMHLCHTLQLYVLQCFSGRERGGRGRACGHTGSLKQTIPQITFMPRTCALNLSICNAFQGENRVGGAEHVGAHWQPQHKQHRLHCIYILATYTNLSG